MPTLLFIKQLDAMDCGPTCLAMVCRYYGKNISLQTLRDKTEIGKEGVNLMGINNAAESILPPQVFAKFFAAACVSDQRRKSLEKQMLPNN